MTKQPRHEKPGEVGAWLPWPLAQRVLDLELRPASRWKVFLVILFTWCRYGQKEAWLTVRQIAKDTNLSQRTVKAALKDLIALRVIKRIGRAGRFSVTLDPHIEGQSAQSPPSGLGGEGEDKLAPPRGKQACPSSNSIYSSSLKEVRGLTKKQTATIRKTLVDASDLLGRDAGDLSLPAESAQRLGLPRGTTYGAAFISLEKNCDAKTAHQFTAAVLALDSDERVQGRELSFENQNDGIRGTNCEELRHDKAAP